MLLNTSSGARHADRIGRYFAKNAEKKANAHLDGQTFWTPYGVMGVTTAADGDALLEDEGYTAG